MNQFVANDYAIDYPTDFTESAFWDSDEPDHNVVYDMLKEKSSKNPKINRSLHSSFS